MASNDQAHYMRLALNEARRSPPKPSNYCVGAVLVNETTGDVLATGYTLELPGNTHAEQCCLQKYAALHGVPEERVHEVLPAAVALYTTMEPCVERLSGNLPCVERIVRTRGGAQGGICKVYSAVREPDTFVKANSARARLMEGGIGYFLVEGFEVEALAVATAGHDERSGESA